jgi:hypothetical protein
MMIQVGKVGLMILDLKLKEGEIHHKDILPKQGMTILTI